MNLRITPNQPDEYINMSWMAQALWKLGRNDQGVIVQPDLVTCRRLSWAPDDPRAIIIHDVVREDAIRAKLGLFQITEEKDGE